MTLAEEWAAWYIRATEVDAETGPGARWVGLRALCTPHGRALRYIGGETPLTDGWCDICDPIDKTIMRTVFYGRPDRLVVHRNSSDRKRGD